MKKLWKSEKTTQTHNKQHNTYTHDDNNNKLNSRRKDNNQPCMLLPPPPPPSPPLRYCSSSISAGDGSCGS